MLIIYIIIKSIKARAGCCKVKNKYDHIILKKNPIKNIINGKQVYLHCL